MRLCFHVTSKIQCLVGLKAIAMDGTVTFIFLKKARFGLGEIIGCLNLGLLAFCVEIKFNAISSHAVERI